MATNAQGGFTMVEIVVMLAILTAVSSIVLVSFSGISQSGAGNRALRELALDIRRTQNMSLAVTKIAVGESPPINQIPPAVGVQITKNSANYMIFGDLPDPTSQLQDFKYTDPSEKIGPSRALQGSVRAQRFLTENGQELPATAIHILFSAPEADMLITDQSGASLGDFVAIELTSASGQNTKQIRVRTSGQISIR